MKIYVKLLSLSLQKHLLKQKWIFHRNLMVVLICARRKAVETASCSCFASAVSSHETNFCLFQRGRFQTTRRNTTDIPTACTKTKVAFSSQFDFFICARRKAVETASCSCFASAFSLHKTNFCLFNVGVFWQQGENVKFIDFATFFHIICFIQ